MHIRALKHSLVAAFALAGVVVLSACNDSNVGDRLKDGTIYAGNNSAATAADAPGLYTWNDGNRYCQDLEANGHDDWALPTKGQLSQLYQNKDAGAFSGTFNDRADGSTLAHWYWASEEHASYSSLAWSQRFTDGVDVWDHKDGYELSVRCVRAEPAAP